MLVVTKKKAGTKMIATFIKGASASDSGCGGKGTTTTMANCTLTMRKLVEGIIAPGDHRVTNI